MIKILHYFDNIFIQYILIAIYIFTSLAKRIENGMAIRHNQPQYLELTSRALIRPTDEVGFNGTDRDKQHMWQSR